MCKNISINEKDSLALKLYKETSIPVFTCKKCLSDYNWNYEDALKNHQKYISKYKIKDKVIMAAKEPTYDELMEGLD